MDSLKVLSLHFICCKDGGKSYKTTVMIADFKAGILTLDLQALKFSGKG